MISVLVLTKNEENDLARCLGSVSWSDDIHVFDSLSTDGTVALAESLGAKVAQREFDGYASQRNAALHGLSFRYPWVLIVDADEIIPPRLAAEIRDFVQRPRPEVAACRIRRRDIFMGTWLRHAQLSPFYLRLVRPDRVRYEREINEVLRVDGLIHDLREPFDHYPFSKGIAHWLDRHNCYSTLEAEMVRRSRGGEIAWSPRKMIFSRDFNERRFNQKELFHRLPLRPWIKWLYMMVYRRAFLDGRAGLAYARLVYLYECMINLKLEEAMNARDRSERPAIVREREPSRPA